MIKIIHGADFHLDSPFSGLTPERAAQRRGEQRELLDALARLALEKRADLVLLSGDLLDSEHVYRETAQALRSALCSLPCPVFIAPGNHDFYGPRSVWSTLDWPDNVHIFDAPEWVDLPGCSLWGRAFTDAHQGACPLEGLEVPDDGRVHLACLHGSDGLRRIAGTAETHQNRRFSAGKEILRRRNNVRGGVGFHFVAVPLIQSLVQGIPYKLTGACPGQDDIKVIRLQNLVKECLQFLPAPCNLVTGLLPCGGLLVNLGQRKLRGSLFAFLWRNIKNIHGFRPP